MKLPSFMLNTACAVTIIFITGCKQTASIKVSHYNLSQRITELDEELELMRNERDSLIKKDKDTVRINSGIRNLESKINIIRNLQDEKFADTDPYPNSSYQVTRSIINAHYELAGEIKNIYQPAFLNLTTNFVVSRIDPSIQDLNIQISTASDEAQKTSLQAKKEKLEAKKVAILKSGIQSVNTIENDMHTLISTTLSTLDTNRLAYERQNIGPHEYGLELKKVLHSFFEDFGNKALAFSNGKTGLLTDAKQIKAANDAVMSSQIPVPEILKSIYLEGEDGYQVSSILELSKSEQIELSQKSIPVSRNLITRPDRIYQSVADPVISFAKHDKDGWVEGPSSVVGTARSKMNIVVVRNSMTDYEIVAFDSDATGTASAIAGYASVGVQATALLLGAPIAQSSSTETTTPATPQNTSQSNTKKSMEKIAKARMEQAERLWEQSSQWNSGTTMDSSITNWAQHVRSVMSPLETNNL